MARPITAEAFAPYGWLVSANERSGRLINDGSSLRVDAADGVGDLTLTASGGTPCIAIFRAQARDIAGPWQTLEAHRLGTQTFIPLAGVRCVLLVAVGAALPDPATLAAFVLPGTCGATLRAGTWHHGLLALDAGDWVVIERRAEAVDCDVADLPEPVTLAMP